MTGFLSDMKREAIDRAEKAAQKAAQAVTEAQKNGVTGEKLEKLQEVATKAQAKYEEMSKPVVVEHVHQKRQIPGSGSGP